MSKLLASDAPKVLPDGAKAIYAAAFNSTDGGDTIAASFAWETVKRVYEQASNGMTWALARAAHEDDELHNPVDVTKRNKNDSDVNYVTESGGIQPCSQCEFFSNRTCSLVLGDIEPSGHCDLFDDLPSAGSMSAVSALSLVITKASTDPVSGERRWAAVCSDTDPDLYGEMMTKELFLDFIARIERGDTAPSQVSSTFWSGGYPYLSVSHYLDQRGLGIVGPSTELYVDGRYLKAKGRFENEQNPGLVDAAYGTIRSELQAADPPENKIRISIAFVDWEHTHDQGRFTFTRKSLSDVCVLCAVNIPVYQYRKGQLIHHALTRVPINTRADFELEEKSMGPTTRKADAASIVGDEHAEALHRRAQESLTSKSVVVKSDSTAEGLTHRGYYDFGNALTITQALEYEEAAKREAQMYDTWYMLQAIMDNIMWANDELVPDKPAALVEAIDDFKHHIDNSVLVTETMLTRMQESIQMTTDVQPVEGTDVTPAVVPEPVAPIPVAAVAERAAHVLDPYILQLKAAYDAAIAQPAQGREAMYTVMQAPFDNLAAVMRAAVDAATPAEAQADLVNLVSDAVNTALAPILPLLQQPHNPTVAANTPQPRQLSMAAPQPVSNGAPASQVLPATPPKSPLDQMVARSVIGSQRAATLEGAK